MLSWISYRIGLYNSLGDRKGDISTLLKGSSAHISLFYQSESSYNLIDWQRPCAQTPLYNSNANLRTNNPSNNGFSFLRHIPQSGLQKMFPGQGGRSIYVWWYWAETNTSWREGYSFVENVYYKHLVNHLVFVYGVVRKKNLLERKSLAFLLGGRVNFWFLISIHLNISVIHQSEHRKGLI